MFFVLFPWVTSILVSFSVPVPVPPGCSFPLFLLIAVHPRRGGFGGDEDQVHGEGKKGGAHSPAVLGRFTRVRERDVELSPGELITGETHI